jgi:hypothetical protein
MISQVRALVFQANAIDKGSVIVSPKRRILKAAANVKEDASSIVIRDAKAVEVHGWLTFSGRRSYQQLDRRMISISFSTSPY